MNNFSRTKKYLIISGSLFILLLISSTGSVFLINLEKTKTQDLVDELSIASKEDIVTLKRAIRNYEENANKIDTFLVDKEKVFDFIKYVEDLAKETGAVVSVQGIDLYDVLKNGETVASTGKENPERSHGNFIMNIRVDGSWNAITNFLLKMENISKHSQIESVRFVSIFDSNTKTTKWSANFNIISTTN